MDADLKVVISCVRKVAGPQCKNINITPETRLFDDGVVDFLVF